MKELMCKATMLTFMTCIFVLFCLVLFLSICYYYLIICVLYYNQPQILFRISQEINKSISKYLLYRLNIKAFTQDFQYRLQHFLEVGQFLRTHRHSLIMLPWGSKSEYNLMRRKRWPCQQMLKTIKAYTHFKGLFTAVLSLPKQTCRFALQPFTITCFSCPWCLSSFSLFSYI